MIVGYRDERGVGKSTDHIREPRQIEPSVHRRDEGHAEAAEQWQMQPIDVRVHDVEIFDPLRDRLELSRACRHRIGGGPAEAQRARTRPGCSFPRGRESPLANKVTSWPRLTSSSTSHATTLSVPP